MSPSRMVYYHSSAPLRSVILACVFDLLLGAAFFYVVYRVAMRFNRWYAAEFLFACILPWMLLVLDPSLLYSAWAHLQSHLVGAGLKPGNYVEADFPVWLRYVVLLTWITLLLILARLAPRIYRSAMTAGGILLMGFGIFSLLAFYSMAKELRWQPDTGIAVAMHARPASQRHARVVWVLMDELSYDQTFADRPAGLQLPNLDALAAQSTVYHNVKPVGYWTEMVLPSLFLGRPVTQIRASRHDQLLINNPDSSAKPRWMKFPTQQAITAEAQSRGWNVGISGWYNNYCSFLSGTFQRCEWTDIENPSGPMLVGASVRQNMLAGFLDQLRLGQEKLTAGVAKREDELLFSRADSLLQDDTMDFVFLHFPLPHPPGVWNRHKKVWARDDPGYVASYEDNLSLCDDEIGRIVARLQASPRWPDTTLMVQGDHSWRVDMWRRRDDWSAEDERNSSGGRFDDRPAVIMHAAGQTVASRQDQPVSLMAVHDMIRQLIDASAAAGPPATHP